MSERDLRHLAAGVDDQHREGMATMAGDIAELHAETRRFRAGGAGLLPRVGAGAGFVTIGTAAMALRGLMPAAAQGDGPLTDQDIAAFAESVELAAVEAYRAAAASGKLQPAVVEVGTLFAGHHAEHAVAFASQSGGKATGKPNEKLLLAVAGQLQAAPDQKGILSIAHDVENAAAATYLFGLGALKSKAALQLAASILPVEAQHAVVLGVALGRSTADVVPNFESVDKALTPANFPTR